MEATFSGTSERERGDGVGGSCVCACALENNLKNAGESALNGPRRQRKKRESPYGVPVVGVVLVLGIGLTLQG